MKKQIPDTGGDAAGVEEGSSGEDQPPQLWHLVSLVRDHHDAHDDHHEHDEPVDHNGVCAVVAMMMLMIEILPRWEVSIQMRWCRGPRLHGGSLPVLFDQTDISLKIVLTWLLWVKTSANSICLIILMTIVLVRDDTVIVSTSVNKTLSSLSRRLPRMGTSVRWIF